MFIAKAILFQKCVDCQSVCVVPVIEPISRRANNYCMIGSVPCESTDDERKKIIEKLGE